MVGSKSPRVPVAEIEKEIVKVAVGVTAGETLLGVNALGVSVAAAPAGSPQTLKVTGSFGPVKDTCTLEVAVLPLNTVKAEGVTESE